MKKMINRTILKENINRRTDFVNSSVIETIELSKITLTEPIHIYSPANFSKQIFRLQQLNIDVLKHPIIIRKIDNDIYALVSGYKGYVIANALNHTLIPAIVVEKSRRDFLRSIGQINPKYIEYPVKYITLPNHFGRVSKEKIQKVLEFYREHDRLDKPICITKDGFLVDNYARYVVAVKILKLRKVPIEYVQKYED